MKSSEQIKLELKELNKEYKSGGMPYKAYKRKFSIIKSYNSIANQVKRYGVKVVKSEGGYKYIGKNFNCDVYLDACEVEYWTTFYDGDNDIIREEAAEYGHSFTSKSEAICFLFELDKSIAKSEGDE